MKKITSLLFVLPLLLTLSSCENNLHSIPPTSIFIKIDFTEPTQNNWKDIKIIFQSAETGKYSGVEIDNGTIGHFKIGFPIHDTIPLPLAPESDPLKRTEQRASDFIDLYGKKGSFIGDLIFVKSTNLRELGRAKCLVEYSRKEYRISITKLIHHQGFSYFDYEIHTGSGTSSNWLQLRVKLDMKGKE